MRRSGSTRLEALPERKADFIEPMECLLVPKLPEGPEWTFEIKFDGYRAIGVKTSREAILYSRKIAPAWGSWRFDNIKSAVIVILLMGLVIASHCGSWIAAAVWAVLLAIAVVSWAVRYDSRISIIVPKDSPTQQARGSSAQSKPQPTFRQHPA